MLELKDFCWTVQQELNDLVGNNYPAYKRERVGLLDAVLSEENVSAQQPVETKTGNGKKKQVIVRYLQPGLVSETSNTDLNICDELGDEQEYEEQLVDVTRKRNSKVMRFSKAQLRKLCEMPGEQRAKIISANMSSLLRAINQDILALYNTQVGGFINGGLAGKEVPVLATGGGNVETAYQKGEVTMKEDFDDLGIDGRPIVVGAGNLSTYSHYAGIGCCNQYGVQIDQLANYAFYKDSDLGAVTGNANDFFAFAPGAIQLLEWNENEGEFAMEDVRSVEGTVIDPVSGLLLDLEMYYDRCEKVYKMYFVKHYDLFVMPDNVYQATDDRFGTNNTFKYRAIVQPPA